MYKRYPDVRLTRVSVLPWCVLTAGLVYLSGCRSEVSSQQREIAEPEGIIAFNSTRDGNQEIYLMDPRGENLKNITNNPALDYGPSWLPDGSGVTAYSNRDGNPELYFFDLQRDTAIRMTEHPDHDVLPAVSPDGSRVVFMSNRNGKSRSVFRMNIDGSALIALTDNSDYEESPSWSPDGRYILFTRQLKDLKDTTHAANGEIFRMRSDGSEVTRITEKTGYDSGAQFSPDGKQIAFYGPDGDTFDIFLINADGGHLRNITRDSLACYSPSWSPDGKWIAYTAGEDNTYDIYIIHPESGEKRRLTRTTVRNEAPAWAPGIIKE
jgi:TolB protein